MQTSSAATSSSCGATTTSSDRTGPCGSGARDPSHAGWSGDQAIGPERHLHRAACHSARVCGDRRHCRGRVAAARSTNNERRPDQPSGASTRHHDSASVGVLAPSALTPCCTARDADHALQPRRARAWCHVQLRPTASGPCGSGATAERRTVPPPWAGSVCCDLGGDWP